MTGPVPDPRLLEPDVVALLEGGCSLAVGTVDAANVPRATRGWGMTVTGRDPVRVRLLLDRQDSATLGNLSEAGSIAITACDVDTLRTLQLKGEALGIEELTDDDRAKVIDYCGRFFANIARVDRYPLAVVERMMPSDFVALDIDVTEIFDQTPGPRAGEPLTVKGS